MHSLLVWGCLFSFQKNRRQWDIKKLENGQTVKLEATKLVNSTKLIMDIDFIYVYKSKTYFGNLWWG